MGCEFVLDPEDLAPNAYAAEKEVGRVLILLVPGLSEETPPTFVCCDTFDPDDPVPVKSPTKSSTMLTLLFDPDDEKLIVIVLPDPEVDAFVPPKTFTTPNEGLTVPESVSKLNEVPEAAWKLGSAPFPFDVNTVPADPRDATFCTPLLASPQRTAYSVTVLPVKSPVVASYVWIPSESMFIELEAAIIYLCC